MKLCKNTVTYFPLCFVLMYDQENRLYHDNNNFSLVY